MAWVSFNSSECPKICNYSEVAAYSSIMAVSDLLWKGSATQQQVVVYRWYSYGPLCFVIAVCSGKDQYKSGKQHWGSKISQVTKFPHTEEPNVLTSDLNTVGLGIERFPKTQTIHPATKKIIPQRNLMSRPCNVSLFCQHKLLPPVILIHNFFIIFYLSWIQHWCRIQGFPKDHSWL